MNKGQVLNVSSDNNNIILYILGMLNTVLELKFLVCQLQ